MNGWPSNSESTYVHSSSPPAENCGHREWPLPRIVLLRESASLHLNQYIDRGGKALKRSVRNIRGITHALHPRWLRGIVNHRRKHEKTYRRKQIANSHHNHVRYR
jgi:hypothetical protein